MQMELGDFDSPLPSIIQGGMGVGVSCWQLANTVARRGFLGVVSGTGIDVVLARRLQLGDPGGHIRRALEHFPCQKTVREILDKYFIPDGKKPEAIFKGPSAFGERPTRERNALVVAANFVEVWLAKEGHNGVVGVNLLEKIILPNCASLYGAILAGVNFVLMGAGIPWQIPGVLDKLARNEPASMKLTREDEAAGEGDEIHFDPRATFDSVPENLSRPKFLAIVSAPVVAQALIKRATGKIDGLIVEGYTAGGHNAPPRGQLKLNELGEPVYGERDIIDIQKLRSLGLPFWLAGGMGRPGQLAEAKKLGAVGVQVGTAFAFSRESGIDPALRARVLKRVKAGTIKVFTDPLASPTGFPFKVIELEGTMWDNEVYGKRGRVCDLGYLRHAYRDADGKTGHRCPADVERLYVAKGGKAEDTVGRKCLCNGLMATMGLAQVRKDGSVEPPIMTSGDDLPLVVQYMKGDADSYSANDVIDALLREEQVEIEGRSTPPSVIDGVPTVP